MSAQKLVKARDIDPIEWNDFITESPEGIVYALYEYINNACPHWQAVIIKSGKSIKAVFPFVVKRKMGVSYFYQPIFTQSWGVFFKPMTSKKSKEYEQKKKLIKEIVACIKPLFTDASFNFTPKFDYPLPFFWEGYSLTAKYTYQINVDRKLEEIWQQTSEGIRRDIKKAKAANFRIEPRNSSKEIIDLFKKRKGKELHGVSLEDYIRLEAIFNALEPMGVASGLVVLNQSNDMLAGIIEYRFKDVTTYFFGTSTAEAKQSGAMSFLLWHAIEQAANEHYAIFDFEGSMVESIERYFRGFGAEPVAYINASKSSKLGNLAKLIRNK